MLLFKSLVAAAALIPTPAGGQAIEAWVQRFSGPGDGNDVPTGLAVDAEGNVVVTGSAGAGYSSIWATLAYSGAGVELWTQRYDGPANGYDEARAVVVDTVGNVIVTGWSLGRSYDYATIKYSGAGIPLWTNRYGGPGNSDDHANAVAVDTSGNVYVTGDAGGYSTIAYSCAGEALWTNRYNGPGNYSDRAFAVAVDASGNTFVTGESDGTAGTGTDYATIAYSSAGLPLWTNRYNGPGNGTDSAKAVVADTSGNVYVTGWSADASGVADYVTIKYATPAITIIRQPVSRTNAVGTTASFSVEVAGSAPFSYQWRQEGKDLLDGGFTSGATTTNLVLREVQPADAAGYSVVITNAYGSVTSIVAQLTVTIAPGPGRFTNFKYSPDTGFSFTFRDGTVGQPYRIQRSPSMVVGSWVDWQAFTYTEPIALTDLGATGAERRFYRAVSP